MDWTHHLRAILHKPLKGPRGPARWNRAPWSLLTLTVRHVGVWALLSDAGDSPVTEPFAPADFPRVVGGPHMATPTAPDYQSRGSNLFGRLNHARNPTIRQPIELIPTPSLARLVAKSFAHRAEQLFTRTPAALISLDPLSGPPFTPPHSPRTVSHPWLSSPRVSVPYANSDVSSPARHMVK